MKLILLVFVLLCLLQCNVIAKKKHKKKVAAKRLKVSGFQSDESRDLEPLPPDFATGECSCVCCKDSQEKQDNFRKCANDIVVAVDSSACFRDYHGKMMRFLKKLVRRISRAKTIQYGGDETRLALMQFSSDILFPLELSSFENYTNPSTKKGILNGINQQLSTLHFLGEGAFLNKALNRTVDEFVNNPRPEVILQSISPQTPRRVVIVITNGKSHPTVTMGDIEYSIDDLESAGITVLPVSVTRQCSGVQSDVWSNEGLCPDPVVMNKLAKVGRPNSATFMEMTSHDTLADIINVLEACHGNSKDEAQKGESCNNCTCSCELPVGLPGPPGLKGDEGDYVRGETGPKGESGSKGEVGARGDKGNKGDEGNEGVKGRIGTKGDSGVNGSTGGKGENGEKGGKGLKGNDGIPGSSGPAGAKGQRGDEGDKGIKGETGRKGEDGSKGETGEKGNLGAKGQTGEKGIGQKGNKGKTGVSGSKGATGSNGRDGGKGEKGRPGLCGKPGPAGRKGEEGLAGVDGQDGDRGPPGREGHRGEPGVLGDKGDKGIHGVPGEIGRPGVIGERGPEGSQGGRGTKGEKGEGSSELGLPGVSGDDGQKGNPGLPGQNGLVGPQGFPGRQGPKGVSGERGDSAAYNLEQLRRVIKDVVEELLPGDCDGEEFNGGDDICTQKPPKGDCNPPGTNTSIGMYYWNTDQESCTFFHYRLCLGGNIFDSLWECQKRCDNRKATLPQTTSSPPIFNEQRCQQLILTDLAFVVDGSASIGKDEFSQLKNFLRSVVEEFIMIDPYGLQIALIQYSTDTRIEIDFDKAINKEAVLDAINNIKYMKGNTFTGDALNLLRQLYGNRNPQLRPGANKVAVLITDGRSQDDVSIPASALKNSGVVMYAVGVGVDTTSELNEIASRPSKKHVYQVNDYDVISSIKDDLVDNICKEAEVTSQEPTPTSRLHDDKSNHDYIEQP